ncbi:1-acyl-sn-glycerol-3-phosphate acyltransferase [Conchiformibius steedae DSM 2580]|uniref:1-acyl-sn-glycerol-3-phosphate acyltransferase n=1 Tax=Conchiformibius steedae DSM 2580 TaxID=1121352 RepID=A0AAE9HV81_9NEIS|nr:lysophospholipid acyltransferase family protein [Conchiformibius steedae]QMT34601.1 1-acyl-sn-glycerol-3-phosphate acyltransferase [Conchiformibius steedae]URD68548.1 1-acyl-sn-glycerol-3-phosphate acyltransferase [Conchiformibius steedae DSM 2580]
MLLMRNLLYWLILSVSAILMFLCVIPAMLFRQGPNKVGRAWARLLLWCLKNIIGLKYEVQGQEHIPSAPAIICAKHQSGWETLALQEIFPLQIYVAKKELFKIPFFGWGLKLAKTIGIDRKAGAKATQQLMQQGLARKNEGFWITIFPEGTRVKAGTRGKYKLGAARMAKLFEMDLVPVAHNSGEYWPRNSFLKYPGTVQVVIGEPVRHSSGDEVALMARCEEWIEAQQEQISGVGPCFDASLKAP